MRDTTAKIRERARTLPTGRDSGIIPSSTAQTASTQITLRSETAAEGVRVGHSQKPRLAIRKNLTSVTDTDFALASHLIEAMQEAGVVRDVRGLINLEIEHHDSRIRILLECGSSILSARSLFPVAPEFLWRTVGTKEGLP